VDGLDAEYWVFHAALTNLPPGDHVLRVRAFYNSPTEILDSDPITITVDPPRTYARVLNLTQDLVLSGSQSLQMVGSNVPGGRGGLTATASASALREPGPDISRWVTPRSWGWENSTMACWQSM